MAVKIYGEREQTGLVWLIEGAPVNMIMNHRFP
jgi:hypothetical protein